MTNRCTFSPDRLYRYTLEHDFEEGLFTNAPRLMPWIGLNPSTADESKLDPTLRRIRGFSQTAVNLWDAHGPFTGFVMLNLFAFRATDPRDMKQWADPVGPGNDAALIEWTKRVGVAVACWGAHGSHLNRAAHVMALLRALNVKVYSLSKNGDGSPRHPLYVPRIAVLTEFSL